MTSDWGKLPIYDHEEMSKYIFNTYLETKKMNLLVVSVCDSIDTKDDDWHVHGLGFLNETRQCIKKALQRKVSALEYKQVMIPTKFIW